MGWWSGCFWNRRCRGGKCDALSASRGACVVHVLPNTKVRDPDDLFVSSSLIIFLDGTIKIPEVQPTRRLAAVDLDWEHLTAADIYLALSAFVPGGGRREKKSNQIDGGRRIRNISVYPSKYGIEQMKKEELHGPSVFVDDNLERNPDDGDDDDDGDADAGTVRQLCSS